MMEDTTYGSYLRHLRTSRGLTIGKLSRMIGISGQYLSEVERGGRKCLALEKTELLINELELTEKETDILYGLFEREWNRIALPQNIITFLETNPDVVSEICKRYGIEI